jgi:hypothetical protein
MEFTKETSGPVNIASLHCKRLVVDLPAEASRAASHQADYSIATSSTRDDGTTRTVRARVFLGFRGARVDDRSILDDHETSQRHSLSDIAEIGGESGGEDRVRKEVWARERAGESCCNLNHGPRIPQCKHRLKF